LRKQTSLYYGPKPKYDIPDDVVTRKVTPKDVARLLQEGNIVSMFQGRSEAGPRALGNRSILFNPTITNGKDIVNKVKRREWFRPFAGTILLDKVDEWFDMRGLKESPFMMFAVQCLDDKKSKIPAIVHEDGTCRIQTLSIEQNMCYYNLIEAFEDLTGVPILFNTSLNLAGEPLVETLEEAIDVLMKSGIEYLYLPEKELLIIVPNERS
jgi:carbamoyltransferase